VIIESLGTAEGNLGGDGGTEGQGGETGMGRKMGKKPIVNRRKFASLNKKRGS